MRPVAWSAAGILVDRVLWGSDAPPSQLALMNPNTSELRELHSDGYIQAAISPDGARLAVSTGTVPIGGQPTFAITVIDTASGEATVLEPEQNGLVRTMRWSPDGTMLLTATAEGYGVMDATLTVQGADGSAKQRLEMMESEYPQRYMDANWDGQTLLVLLGIDERAELSAVSLSRFEQGALQPIGSVDVGADVVSTLLYIP